MTAQPARSSFRTGVHTALAHDSAVRHVTGAAAYIDDMPTPPGTLHAAMVLSPVAHGRLHRIDTGAALRAPGVVAVMTAADIPGRNDIGPIFPNEPLLAETLVEHHGQPVAMVAARTLDQARAAAKLVVLDIEELPPILTIEAALATRSFLIPPMVVQTGDVDAALAAAPHRLTGRVAVGGQEHFYLEGQVALALPGEDGDVTVHSSTQNPTEVQHVCAHLLGCDFNRVTAMVRRLGGGFGGKESNASWIAGAAALLARRTMKPVKLRLPREADMLSTGKRHAFLTTYEVGFDESGRVCALRADLAALGGHVTDHTPGVMTRALTHVDGAYFIPNVRATGYSCKTNTVSNTAFRGYGGPQGVMVMEDAVTRIAARLGRTAEEIRAVNVYGHAGDGRDMTPYGQRVTDNIIARCVAEVTEKADWPARRAAIDAFNAASPVIKRGLGMFPLKFGLSFNKVSLNQAGALVHVYADGSIRLNHGGTEMGQGLFTKVAQVVAEVFQVDIDRIALAATSTGEVPNTSPTAASAGSDLNGMAAHVAATALRGRMAAVAAEHWGVAVESVEFRDNDVRVGPEGDNRHMRFDELAHMAWQARVSLSATGFYKTPDLAWDQANLRGAPFFYFTYGAAVSEVAIDTLTGECRVLRADLLQDCGASLNPAIDLGQVEGGFVQGAGWLTCEELWWDAAGRLRTVGPSTYKIPGSRDAPAEFNVHLLEDAPNPMATVFRSKGIGEPPLLLAVSVWTALKDAIGSVGDRREPVELDCPATPERILAALDRRQ